LLILPSNLRVAITFDFVRKSIAKSIKQKHNKVHV
jgi:hypothetical protein